VKNVWDYEDYAVCVHLVGWDPQLNVGNVEGKEVQIIDRLRSIEEAVLDGLSNYVFRIAGEHVNLILEHYLLRLNLFADQTPLKLILLF
jgi:hypothetical protein